MVKGTDGELLDWAAGLSTTEWIVQHRNMDELIKE